jgi:peptidoglycan/LPS O-acetylase OafA/YrhL
MASHFLPQKLLGGIEWGIYGVTLFFVISGFLITGILYEHRDQPIRKVLWSFYARRFIRIFPLYYLSLIAVVCLGSVQLGGDVLWHVFYASNWYFWLEGSWVTGHPVHYWSLAVEEQFYLLWPLVFLFGSKRWLKMPLFLCFIGISFRLVMLSFGWTSHAWTKLTPACFEALGVGAALAVMMKKGISPLRIRSFLFFVIGFFVVHAWQVSTEWGYELRYQSVVLLSGVTVLSVCSWSNTWLDPFFSNKMVRYVGTISYGIYIWHLFTPGPWLIIRPFWKGLCQNWGFPGWIEFGVGDLMGKLILTLVFASATWFAFERPLLKLKKRFNYSE